MTPEKQAIIEKISKILIKAESTKGTPEGDSFKSAAARLMAKYRIKETEVDLETDAFILDTFEFAIDGKRVPQWVGQIVGIFAHTFDCKVVSCKHPDRQEWEVIGTFSDVETVLYFTEVVSHHIETAGWKTWKKTGEYNKREQLGNVAALVVWERAYELKAQMDKTIHEDVGCTDLVIQKGKEVTEALEEMYPNLRPGKHEKRNMPRDAKTRDAGTKAGKTAPLNFAIEA